MILGLKTADMTAQLWIFDPHRAEPLAHLQWDSGRTLSDDLLGRITELVASHDLTLEALNGIILFSGPGSFTSLRIGHTVANALADSLRIPIVGAGGDRWLADAQAGLKSARAGVPVMPYYGAEANITKRVK